MARGMIDDKTIKRGSSAREMVRIDSGVREMQSRRRRTLGRAPQLEEDNRLCPKLSGFKILRFLHVPCTRGPTQENIDLDGATLLAVRKVIL